MISTMAFCTCVEQVTVISVATFNVVEIITHFATLLENSWTALFVYICSFNAGIILLDRGTKRAKLRGVIDKIADLTSAN